MLYFTNTANSQNHDSNQYLQLILHDIHGLSDPEADIEHEPLFVQSNNRLMVWSLHTTPRDHYAVTAVSPTSVENRLLGLKHAFIHDVWLNIT